jgi:hypothetical protein
MESAGRASGPCHQLTIGRATGLGLAFASALAESLREVTGGAAVGGARPPSLGAAVIEGDCRGIWRPDSPETLSRLVDSVTWTEVAGGQARTGNDSPPRAAAPADGYAVRTLRHLASVLDQAGHLDSSQELFHMAFGCIQLPSGKGGRSCPLAYRHEHKGGTKIDWDDWLREAKTVLSRAGRNLRSEFGPGHPHVLEADSLTDFILTSDGNLGEPDPESAARFRGELRRHLGRRLDEADRMVARGWCMDAIRVCFRVLNTTYMDPEPFGDIQVRTCECDGRANLAATIAPRGRQMFDSACFIASEWGIGPENPDLQAAQVGMALAKHELERNGERSSNLLGRSYPFSMESLERRLGPRNEITLKASAVTGGALPSLTAYGDPPGPPEPDLLP